jgi:type IV pilus assembly protein PilA
LAHEEVNRARGYTIVEVLIVVAVIGVLAVLAYYAVHRYLSATKAAEAKQNVGDIARAAYAAYQREIVPAQNVGEGTESLATSRQLCGSALPVPALVPGGTKYQPDSAPGQDFQVGTSAGGWMCLRFYVAAPIYHQYHYTRDGGPVAQGTGIECLSDCFEAGALGDVDDDGQYSRFARTGQINTTTGELKASTRIHVHNGDE